ncbi:hypothetical protein ELE36_16980 [Pseudolysobacter antarcticus]|uniref:Uncharacterized protein n=1 Tax=Pseudolysobacter antarcticus TaxID=2511995 RepID=A0A411HN79_9GAMM|nr:hypothetical protein [Pseudolysobacter antarcticus]QBB71916.1 hypothetical protein ELE36_16980 [Pseudolysobacter antarcticus]
MKAPFDGNLGCRPFFVGRNFLGSSGAALGLAFGRDVGRACDYDSGALKVRLAYLRDDDCSLAKRSSIAPTPRLALPALCSKSAMFSRVRQL